MTNTNERFSSETLEKLFPADRTDDFFDALLGDASEGAYHISLACKDMTSDELRFEFRLTQRPGKCLACNLTYGLPQVFGRHPIINVNGLVEEIDRMLGDEANCSGWRLGSTREVTQDLHVIPLIIYLER